MKSDSKELLVAGFLWGLIAAVCSLMLICGGHSLDTWEDPPPQAVSVDWEVYDECIELAPTWKDRDECYREYVAAPTTGVR